MNDPTLIIGTGLIGASIGQCLREHGVEVFLSDIDHANAVVAASRGAGVVARPRPETVELVIVATPPAVVPEIVVAALRRYPNAVVTDVASVKASIEAAVLAGVADHTDARRYVGSHPMAGSQHAGPLTAEAELFLDRTWVVIERADQDAQAVAAVRALIEICGAREVDLDAATHDRAVAAVSHLPQLMASLTAARLLDDVPADLTLAGQGVRDVTRIAASDVRMWRQIVAANTMAVRDQLRAVQADLNILIDQLDDPAVVEDLLSRGRAGAAALPGKHGQAPSELMSVVVQIPDTPGALAHLFADIDQEGVNVEDLNIEHDPVREAGFLAVAVTPDRAEPLADALRDRGWLVR
ncbi:MAG: prephenate dehydrogenase [Propionibacteriaceae bacterium]|nr:prephenate dehydrogenase [Propionibacteriaceae bacterium]